MAKSSELARFDLVREAFESVSPSADVAVGIGDDAAIFRNPNGLAWSVDAAVEGVHFRRDWLTLREIGFRATMAAASDLAAAGARPLGVTGALILPTTFSDEELAQLCRGQAEACRVLGAPMVGGNLSRGNELSITTGVLGIAPRPLLRGGARADDDLWLSGTLGWSRLALAGLLAGHEAIDPRARRAFATPIARINDGLSAAENGATAAIDVSDGLAQDVGHLARESDVDVVLDKAALYDEALFAAAAAAGFDPWRAILHGGEDFALVVAAPPLVELPGFRRIGTCERGEGTVYIEDGEQREALTPEGHDHFANR